MKHTNNGKIVVKVDTFDAYSIIRTDLLVILIDR